MTASGYMPTREEYERLVKENEQLRKDNETLKLERDYRPRMDNYERLSEDAERLYNHCCYMRDMVHVPIDSLVKINTDLAAHEALKDGSK